MRKKKIVQYSVHTVSEAKKLAKIWLAESNLEKSVSFGLPEVDDRYHLWRVPLLSKESKHKVGEVVIDAVTTLIDEKKSSQPTIIESRLLNRSVVKPKPRAKSMYEVSEQRNTIALGDAEFVLREMASRSADLVFTSPPYFNARPEYSDYITYEDYLLKMRKIIRECHRVLNEGRFFVINVSPVLLRRANRNEASKRIAVPFDLHKIFIEEGFDFIDDILWVKPEGAGWATGRGRRFAADRNPLQYKPVPVTEYIMVYRKQTDKLIDWNIRNYPDSRIVEASKLHGEYDKTNLWKITPTWDKVHPAVFPLALAERVIKYYSFKTDVVLDPFAGVGTTGQAAVKNGRRFVLIDIDKKYVDETAKRAKKWLGKASTDILFMNCQPAEDQGSML